jgi:hypothetical protein
MNTDKATEERALAIARHLDRQQPVVRQHGLATGPIAMIRLVGLRPTGRIAHMVGQLNAEGALDDGLLEPADRRLELLGRQRSLADKLIENFCGTGVSGASGISVLRRRGLVAPHVMPHTRNS